MSANPAMKYMQYLMPVMFFGFFNTYASGLTCYMFFSNLINISQTVISKSFIFNDEKLREELNAKKAAPKAAAKAAPKTAAKKAAPKTAAKTPAKKA